MYKPVVLINLKYKGIVDIIATEYLDRKACSEEDEADNKCEIVCVQPGIYLVPPIIILILQRTYS